MFINFECDDFMNNSEKFRWTCINKSKELLVDLAEKKKNKIVDDIVIDYASWLLEQILIKYDKEN